MHELVRAGVFEEEPVELIDGTLAVGDAGGVTVQRDPFASAITSQHDDGTGPAPIG